ncbi:MAG: hypothetical protein BEN18_07265 [Epulopiscium sp. Nuni2H_MBin001]|nr:MAG: hypothetical protein BEN18_07265 [Epulopiscium sp. Nuni2H_MBin001]
MKRWLYPQQYVTSIYDVDYEQLKQQGIKGLIFDIDNTLVPYHVKEPTQEIVDLIINLKDKGFRITLVSNNTRIRVLRFNQQLKLNAIYNAYKPRRLNLHQAIERMKLKASQVAIIGDQIFTDILGGNRAGIHTILVQPVSEKDEPITKIKRGVEKKIIEQYVKSISQ